MVNSEKSSDKLHPELGLIICKTMREIVRHEDTEIEARMHDAETVAGAAVVHETTLQVQANRVKR